MHATRELRLASGDGAQVLELPYAGGSAAMLVIKPDRVDGLAELEARLDGDSLAHWRRLLRPARVEVALPRFTVDPAGSLALKAILIALGMPAAFDLARADFSGINPELYVDKVFHKAFVKVDEQGTKAAAATAVMMAPRGMPPSSVPFHVDRPFLFAIVDQASGLVLFLGRVVDPAAG